MESEFEVTAAFLPRRVGGLFEKKYVLLVMVLLDGEYFCCRVIAKFAFGNGLSERIHFESVEGGG